MKAGFPTNEKTAAAPMPPVLPPATLNSQVMLTSLELLDRAAEIECATALRGQRRTPTEFDGLGVALAHWCATYGFGVSWRILLVAAKALLHLVWKPRARRTPLPPRLEPENTHVKHRLWHRFSSSTTNPKAARSE